MSERFTAVIKIVKVEEEIQRNVRINGGRDTEDRRHSTDTELLAITVRKGSLPALLEAAKSHLDLVLDTEEVK